MLSPIRTGLWQAEVASFTEVHRMVATDVTSVSLDAGILRTLVQPQSLVGARVAISAAAWVAGPASAGTDDLSTVSGVMTRTSRSPFLLWTWLVLAIALVVSEMTSRRRRQIIGR